MRLSAALSAVGIVIAAVGIEGVRQRRPEPELARDLGRAAPAQPELPGKAA
jgi:hypothetical protein